ncbi:MAG TPA: DUF58 domain-containing protein [Verrucomicrobiales bacterium]|nr:DUF58 domain-containing protein [Verrucomicrobiales bacterium]
MALSDSFSAAKTGRMPPPVPKRAVKTPPIPAVRGQRVLKAAELDPLKNLLLFAESIVQGWFAGKHRSFDFGSNAEFVEHKAYVPGDPMVHLDWKVYARCRKLVVRKHREEKQMAANLVVDVSGSMAYKVEGRDGKQLRAARIAAALAWLMQRQGDKFSLTLFTDTLVRHIPAGGTRRHLFDCLAALEDRLDSNRGRTGAHSALDLCVPLFKRRGSIIFISDFFTDLDRFFDAIAQFQHRRFDILLLHVIDPDERLLPEVPLARFVDMETGASIQVAPDEVRIAYQREMAAMTERITTEALRRGLAYHILKTEEPYREALEAWLGLRGRAAGRPAGN